MLISIEIAKKCKHFEHFKAHSYALCEYHFLKGNMFSLTPQKIASKCLQRR